MNTAIKAVAGAALALSVSFGFAQAASLTTNQVNAILNLLQSFGADQSIINNVQLSLTGGTPSVSSSTVNMPAPGPTANDNGQGQGPSSCLTFNRDLGEGDQGDDVRSLQQMLSESGDFNASTTGFFGPLTARALAMWQEHNGIASSTQGGALGPLTRGFFERRCGAGEGDNGRGNGGIPGNGGVMGSTTPGMMPMIPAPHGQEGSDH